MRSRCTGVPFILAGANLRIHVDNVRRQLYEHEDSTCCSYIGSHHGYSRSRSPDLGQYVDPTSRFNQPLASSTPMSFRGFANITSVTP